MEEAYRFRVSEDSSRNLGGRRSAVMQKPEVIALLSSKAAELGERFSERMLRDWSDEGLIQPADRVSETLNEWSYATDTIKRGELILALKKDGIRRADLLVLYVWVAGNEIETWRIVSALESEFRRTLRRVRRKSPPPCDVREGGEPNAWQMRRLAPENQQLDPAFQEIGISYSPDFLKMLHSAIYWGVPEGSTGGNIADQIFSGVFGDPDEIEGSLIQDFGRLTNQDLSKTKEILENVIYGFLFLPILFKGFIPSEIWDKIIPLGEKIARSLISPEWLPLALAFIAVNVCRYRNSHDEN